MSALKLSSSGATESASSHSPLRNNEAELGRVLQICNACRYCEGFCGVFQAMTQRLEFGRGDFHYLANLCHNCGACLHACQYAPPHEFAVNIPQATAKVRAQTYADFAWPKALSVLYQRNGLTVAIALAIGLALFLILALVMQGTLLHPPLAGNFYAVFPHNLLVGMFAPVFLFAVLALGIGVVHFWRSLKPGTVHRSNTPALLNAGQNILQLTYLKGGHGAGCAEADDAYTLARRRYHHLTFHGFLLCFTSTCVATLYHYFFAWPAPYAWSSLPVILGTLGGMGLLIGPLGLFWLNLQRHPQHGDSRRCCGACCPSAGIRSRTNHHRASGRHIGYTNASSGQFDP